MNKEKNKMKKTFIAAASVALLVCTSANAINAKYRQQLERSGCTQVSEAQGCDIHKTKAENAKGGFVSNIPTDSRMATNKTSYAGQWVAKATSDATVATIRIDGKEHVWVNGKRVKAKRSNGTLVFRDGYITYTIHGDRRLNNQNHWSNSDAKTKGSIFVE